MCWDFEQNTRGVESNGSAYISFEPSKISQSEAYPIIRSYCCCRMLIETWQSTPPVVSVMARASAMSFWIVGGIAAFLLAGPTHTSVAPRCSNSLAPNCVISAPDTNDRTTFVGNLCSRCDSTPKVCVVFTNMHVCWGVTTGSMTAARS